MSKHTVTEDELHDFVERERNSWALFASSPSGDTRKSLEVRLGNVAAIYLVKQDGRGVYIGALAETAVREYNALP